MRGLDSLTFDTTGLAHAQDQGNRRIWLAPDRDIYALMYFPVPPNIDVPLRDIGKVRARYRDLLRDSYEAYRGHEVSSQGDGFLTRFERPGDAVQCAIDFQRKLHDQRRQFGFAPAVRIGINAGDAIEEQGDVLGTTVNLASRVTGTAEPNEILVTEAVADALDDRFRLRDGGLREMKGLDRSVHVISVSWE